MYLTAQTRVASSDAEASAIQYRGFAWVLVPTRTHLACPQSLVLGPAKGLVRASCHLRRLSLDPCPLATAWKVYGVGSVLAQLEEHPSPNSRRHHEVALDLSAWAPPVFCALGNSRAFISIVIYSLVLASLFLPSSLPVFNPNSSLLAPRLSPACLLFDTYLYICIYHIPDLHMQVRCDHPRPRFQVARPVATPPQTPSSTQRFLCP